jgi:hypothetical protein
LAIAAAVVLDDDDDDDDDDVPGFVIDIGGGRLDVAQSPETSTSAGPQDADVSDTLRALEAEIERLRDETRESRRELARAEDALDEAGSSGLFSWLAGLVDDLGLGFGWAALYTTVLLSATNGQTLGKRLLGIRVRRLDGQPLNWWVAFERAGGYAAGFATGLLGFAQVYWDANRQCIHDRIVGTVVVRDGAPRVRNWESVL